MKHTISVDGYGYRLRPVKVEDAGFIIDVRLSDKKRNKFLHNISDDLEKQKAWIENYYNQEGDYYFVIENRLTKTPEGLIGIYNIENNKAEWGRWVTTEGSMCPAESVDLIYKVAFSELGLDELYCHTIKDNERVVDFHTSVGEKTRKILEGACELDGEIYDIVEQYADKAQYENVIHPLLSQKAHRIFERNIKKELGAMEFHHIGVAVKSISSEMGSFQLLGYRPEGEVFDDDRQGIKGLFMIAKDQPRIELLQNLPDSHTLDSFIEKNTKLYHYAYLVDDVDNAVQKFKNIRCKVISQAKMSVYFETKICFLILPNMFMIELIEKKKEE